MVAVVREQIRHEQVAVAIRLSDLLIAHEGADMADAGHADECEALLHGARREDTAADADDRSRRVDGGDGLSIDVLLRHIIRPNRIWYSSSPSTSADSPPSARSR